MRRRHLLLGALLTAIASPAAPQPAPALPRTQVRFVGGDCDALVMSGARLTGCKPRLTTMLYRSGQVSFVFSGRDGRLVSFLGRIQRRLGDQTLLKLSQITFVPRGGAKAFASPAKGNCILAAFAINRSRLECRARSGRSLYSALFRTADEEPIFVTL